MKIGARTKRRMIKLLIMNIYQNNSGNDEHENDNENNDDMSVNKNT